MNKSYTNGPLTPTTQEVEKLRLILSTYQDGTGMLAVPDGLTLPGWRDFERAVAVTFEGEAQESKFIFDVLVPLPTNTKVKYGISCKMRGELNKALVEDGRVTMELSNSSKQFWRYLQTFGIDEANYRNKPREVGIRIIELIESWHRLASATMADTIDLTRSSYLVLSWSTKRYYQLHQFTLNLPNPNTLQWYFPLKRTKDGEEPANRLCGADDSGVVFEWYGQSGGQLKYYPLVRNSIWTSKIFQLEPLPSLENMKYGIIAKTKSYFPTQWQKADRNP